MKIAIINGPNLNLLGKREPELYGERTFESHLEALKKAFGTVSITYFQSNVEGELINQVHASALNANGIIINAGAYTHTSIALADAVAAIKVPVVEVHISNIFAREDYRHVSFLGSKCRGSISGFGLYGYNLAMTYLLDEA
jgi:3-dehydroquinate dehydratase-2